MFGLKRFRKQVTEWWNRQFGNGALSPAQRFAQFECIYETEHCAIYFQDCCKATRAFVSFTGVGHALGGLDVQAPEFIGAGRSAMLFFVVDKTRSWGNRLSMDEIAAVVLDRVEGRELVSIGNSMGGFLAILMSRKLGADHVIAFAPQWSVDPEVMPQETRWRSYRDTIETFQFSDLQHSFERSCRYLVLFGGTEDEDMHRRMFPNRPEVEVIRLQDSGHNVARFLKDHQALYPVIEAFIRADDVGQELAENGIEYGNRDQTCG